MSSKMQFLFPVLFSWSEVLLMCKVFGKKIFKDKVIPCTLTVIPFSARETSENTSQRSQGLRLEIFQLFTSKLAVNTEKIYGHNLIAINVEFIDSLTLIEHA